MKKEFVVKVSNGCDTYDLCRTPIYIGAVRVYGTTDLTNSVKGVWIETEWVEIETEEEAAEISLKHDGLIYRDIDDTWFVVNSYSLRRFRKGEVR